jgi:hypothetical protein
MNEEIYSREQKRLALMFNVFMKASFVPGRLIVNKSKPAGSRWRAFHIIVTRPATQPENL